MIARIRELYGEDIVFFIAFIAAIATFAISITVGIIAIYLFCMVASYQLWQEDLAPFSWQDGDSSKRLLVLLGPLTLLGVMAGIVLWLAFAPFLQMRSLRQRSNEPLNKRSWAIGIAIYYSFWLIVAIIVIRVLQ